MVGAPRLAGVLVHLIGRSSVKRFALCYRTVVCLVLSVLSVTLVHCGQTVGRIKMKLGMQLGLGPSHNMCYMGPRSPSPKGHSPRPQFSATICCGQMDRWIKMRLGTKVGIDPSDIVLDEDLAPLPERGTGPQFLPHVCCGQTAGWLKMPLSTMVGISARETDTDPAPPQGTEFRPMSVVAKGLIGSRYHLRKVGVGQATLC